MLKFTRLLNKPKKARRHHEPPMTDEQIEEVRKKFNIKPSKPYVGFNYDTIDKGS